jgi:hypothetical protein
VFQDAPWLHMAAVLLADEPKQSPCDFSSSQSFLRSVEIVPAYQRNCSYLI